MIDFKKLIDSLETFTEAEVEIFIDKVEAKMEEKIKNNPYENEWVVSVDVPEGENKAKTMCMYIQQEYTSKGRTQMNVEMNHSSNYKHDKYELLFRVGRNM